MIVSHAFIDSVQTILILRTSLTMRISSFTVQKLMSLKQNLKHYIME